MFFIPLPIPVIQGDNPQETVFPGKTTVSVWGPLPSTCTIKMPEKWKTPPPGEFWSSSELSSALPALSLAGSQRSGDLFANMERDEWPGTTWS